MIRKIEVNKQGKIVHIYTINDNYDPHNPNGGLEVNNNQSALYEDIMEFFCEYAEMYIYDKIDGLRKRKKSECKPEYVPNLEYFDELPQNFIIHDKEISK